MFSGPAWLVAQFYALTHSYAVAIGMIALVVMLLVTPLTLKSTKGMLEMQRLQPEMKRLQAQHRGDRQKLNEEMMKLYQEHKVNPLASCLPLLLQMPVFFIMYRVLHGLSNRGSDGTFNSSYISKTSELYKSLDNKTEMLSLGLDLSRTPAHFISESFGKGLIYAFLVVVLAVLYFVQQRMVASRAAASPTMSAGQAKLMQYLPVAFAVFQIFFLTGLVIYYIVQTLFRIAQNAYITRRFYHGEESLGQLAQAAGQRARDEAKANGTDTSGPGGMFAQAKRDAQARRESQDAARKGASSTAKPAGKGRPGERPATTKSGTTQTGADKVSAEKSVPAVTSKRVTPPKNRPTPSSSRPQRPSASGRSGAPAKPKPPKK